MLGCFSELVHLGIKVVTELSYTVTLVILRALLCLAIALKAAVGCCASLCGFCLQPFSHGSAPALVFWEGPIVSPTQAGEAQIGGVQACVGKPRTLQPK